MGTRGAYGFKADGKYFVTYNHFDSYPSGLGVEILKFLAHVKETNGWEDLKNKVNGLKLVKESMTPTSDEIEKYKNVADVKVANQSLTDWYCLLRNFQFGDILWAIETGEVAHMIDNFEFLKDSLFCEYAYIIDLDNMLLSYYEGSQKEPSVTNLPVEMKADDGYYPVKLMDSFPLEDLPAMLTDGSEDE
jgi:hypothetical protein